MRLDPEIERRVARWAERHHGHIRRADALSMGHTVETLKARVRSGSLERVTSRVLRMPGVPRTPEGDLYAALADGPPGTVASHLSTAALYGWRRHPSLPHVTIPYGGNTRLIAAVHRSRLDPVDTTLVGVMPATSPARTLVDCAAVLDLETLNEIVDAAFTSGRVNQRVVQAAIDRAGARPGRKGIPLLRDALAIWQPGIERDSIAEARLFRLLVAWGLPPPVALHRIDDRCELDVAWPEAMVALEYDSARFHGPRRWSRDEDRCAIARALGWTVVPVDKTDLRPGGHQRLPSRLEQLLRTPAPTTGPRRAGAS